MSTGEVVEQAQRAAAEQPAVDTAAPLCPNATRSMARVSSGSGSDDPSDPLSSRAPMSRRDSATAGVAARNAWHSLAASFDHASRAAAARAEVSVVQRYR